MANKGVKVGKIKPAKGTKLMVIADASGLLGVLHTDPANPTKSNLRRLRSRNCHRGILRIIGERAYDSVPLDAPLLVKELDLLCRIGQNVKRPPRKMVGSLQV